MFDRFTDRARKVMALARKEAQRFNHDFIGTEHILLGLIQEGSGAAANVLKNLGVEIEKIRRRSRRTFSPGPSMVTMGQLPSRRARRCSSSRWRKPTSSATITSGPSTSCWG